jgi:hypothetical protein
VCGVAERSCQDLAPGAYGQPCASTRTCRPKEKAVGIRRLSFNGYERNKAWLLAANIASDLIAFLQLLGLKDKAEMSVAEPETLRAMVLHNPGTVGHPRPHADPGDRADLALSERHRRGL